MIGTFSNVAYSQVKNPEKQAANVPTAIRNATTRRSDMGDPPAATAAGGFVVVGRRLRSSRAG